MSSSSEMTRSRVGGTQRHFGQPLPATDPEQVADRDQHARFGQYGMDLGFEPGTDRDKFGPIAHQLPQLACLPVARSRPRAVDPSAVDQPDHQRRGRRFSPAGIEIL